MKKQILTPLLQQVQGIYDAAAASDDGHRCMIGPSPKLKEKLKEDMKKVDKLVMNSSLGLLLKPVLKTRLGLNDPLIYPGNVFPLGTSAMAVRKAAVARTPLRGTLKVAVVLVEFPDKKMQASKKYFEDLFFSTGVVATGSVKEYYKEVTDGLVDIAGTVLGPYLLPKKLSQYAHGESGTGNAVPNARTMAADTAVLANPHIDFTSYDNDHDGYVDAFVVVHAGTGAEETGSPNDIWSHKWLLPSVYNADGTKIYGYLTVPEDCKLGVCAHELGHLLFGFPDLYDIELPGEGIGDWCLMSGGSWNNQGFTPAHPCAWCKMQQNWVTTVTPTENQKSVPIDDVKKTKRVYKLWKDGGPGNEYFLLENRQLAKYDKFLPGAGLLIYHIDDNIEDNSNEAHYKVALMQADGKKQLESGANRGDAADAWPGSAKKTEFTASTNPNSKSYGGLDTLVQVKSIKKQSGLVIADLYVKAGAAVAKKKKKKKEPTKKAKKK